MARDPLTELSTRTTPQSRAASPRQVPNNAGGFTFRVTPWTRLDRFLLLGVDGGSYYVKPRDLALDNLAALRDLIALDGLQVCRRVVEVSQAGLAPRQQPGLFVLAAVISFGNLEGRRAAAEAVPLVARTGSTLKTFVQYVEQFRGWGPVLRRGVSDWYLNQPIEKLAYQAVKYRTRVGWSDRDVLRMAHPKPEKNDLVRRELFDWICGRKRAADVLGLTVLLPEDPLRIIEGFERIQRASKNEYAKLIADYRLPWEALPDAAMNVPAVWEAMLENGVPQTALLRQLPRLTRIGLLPNTGGWTNEVVHQLTNPELLKRGRIHPISVLFALKTYASGYSFRGNSTWQPTRRIVDALDTAFYAAFEAIEPTGKRVMLALDISGSMNVTIADSNLSCREAAAALALTTASVEKDYEIVGFTTKDGNRINMRWGSEDWHSNSACRPLAISPRQRLDDAVRACHELPMGGTDCAQPMLYALKNNIKIDTFVIYTDNETWAGNVHPHQALRRYREKMGIPARLVVVGMTATDFTIADPTDSGMLDVTGFDASVPQLISSFSRGEI
jgi:60 kDa SS-A/Ro ribonucleoprotein